MIVTELIIFTVSAMIGIFLYWTESKNNALYRTINRITHTESLQMKTSERKGFLYQQPFLIRFIVIVLLFLFISLAFKILLPIPYRFDLYVSSVVGALLGTYFASLIVSTTDKIEEGQETFDETMEAGKGKLKELANAAKEKAKELKDKIEDTLDFDDDTTENVKEVKSKDTTPELSKKSGRERLKDKGLL